jgi:hypothetical protein
VREDASTAATIAGITHVNELVDRPSSAYIAPDALTARDADPALLVVFSLGAIAFYVFCDERPAASYAELVAILQRDGALEVAAKVDGASGLVAESVRAATRAINDDLLGPYIVDRRLGPGATAIALLVEDEDERRWVLKVANDPERTDRLPDEGEVLDKISSSEWRR